MKNKSIIMAFCLFLMLWAGSASAETNDTTDVVVPADNNTQVNDTPPSNDLPADNTGDDAEVDDGSEVDEEDPADDGAEVDEEDPVDDGAEVDEEDPVDDSEDVDDETDNSADDGNETVDEITDEILPPTDDEVDDDESSDDIPPYEGAVGPGHALYGLRIAFENVGQTFTYNESERLGKQVSAARHRIAEARHMMKKGDDEAVDIAMTQYKNKMKGIEVSIDNATDETALTSAQQKLNKHQKVIEELAREKKSKGGNSKWLDSALQENQKVDEKFQLKKMEKTGKSDKFNGKGKMTDENLTVNKTDDSKRGKGKNRNL